MFKVMQLAHSKDDSTYVLLIIKKVRYICNLKNKKLASNLEKREKKISSNK